jgi:hypothetical protein
MARSLGQTSLVVAIALLILPLALYASSGENDWIIATLVGEPTVLALYLARTRRPADRSLRLLLSWALLIPLGAVLIFFALFVFVLLTHGRAAFA